MAKFNLENYTTADGLGFPLNFRRGNPNPLDNSSVWASLEAAQNYAANDSTAYVGQILSVVDNVAGIVTVYSIQDEAGTLTPVGTSPVGDEKSIVVAEDGTISLFGIAGLSFTDEEGKAIQYQPLMTASGLTWVVPSATTVEGLDLRLSGVETVVGNTESGLVKDVADNASAIEKLNGTGEGSVSKAVSDAVGALQGETTSTVKDVEDSVATLTQDLEEHTHVVADITGFDEKVKAYDYATKTEAQGYADVAKQAADDAQADVDALAERVTTDEANIQKNTDAITKLNANAETEGSVDYKIAQAVAQIVENPDDTMNSINELVTWCNDHAQDALELSNKVTANEGDITALEELVGSKAVATQITEAIAEALKIDGVDKYALASDLVAAIGRVAVLEGKVTAWDSAEQNAKDYADGLNSSMNTRVEALEAIDHEHTNKELLDTYTQTEADLADAVAKKHSHTFAETELNKIADGDVAKWNAAEQNAKDYTDSVKTELSGSVKSNADAIKELQDVGAQANVIESIKKNGTVLSIVDKSVDISVPTKLDELGGYIELTTLVNKKVDAVDNASLVDNDDILKLQGLANIKNVSTEFVISEAGELGVNSVSVDKVTGLTELINEKHNVVATDTILGVVLSNAVENGVTVAEDGKMSVHSVNVNKLTQSDGEYLILNGGSAV